jgi:hypothetical protein
MIEADVQNAIAQIHAAPNKMVLEFAGAGSLVLWWLHSVAGSSRTVLEATDRYAVSSLSHLLGGGQPESFVSVETAEAMARQAYERAIQLDGTQNTTFLLGVGCTATIATSYEKRGEHHCALAIQSSEGITTYDLRMKKGFRDRLGEEILIGRLLIRAILSACGLRQSLPLEFAAGEKLRENHQSHTDPLDHLLSHQVYTVTIYPDGSQAANHPVAGGIVSGAFHPLHQGHEKLAEAASSFLGLPVVFELPIVNADKGMLTIVEVKQRLQQFRGKHTIVLSRAPLFSDKAGLFPGCVFVVGYDTAVRLISPHYYGGESGMHVALKTIRSAGCRFLVAGRMVHERFHTLSDISLPPAFQDLFTELPETCFRADISSTEIREASK